TRGAPPRIELGERLRQPRGCPRGRCCGYALVRIAASQLVATTPHAHEPVTQSSERRPEASRWNSKRASHGPAPGAGLSIIGAPAPGTLHCSCCGISMMSRLNGNITGRTGNIIESTSTAVLAVGTFVLLKTSTL